MNGGVVDLLYQTTEMMERDMQRRHEEYVRQMGIWREYLTSLTALVNTDASVKIESLENGEVKSVEVADDVSKEDEGTLMTDEVVNDPPVTDDVVETDGELPSSVVEEWVPDGTASLADVDVGIDNEANGEPMGDLVDDHPEISAKVVVDEAKEEHVDGLTDDLMDDGWTNVVDETAQELDVAELPKVSGDVVGELADGTQRIVCQDGMIFYNGIHDLEPPADVAERCPWTTWMWNVRRRYAEALAYTEVEEAELLKVQDLMADLVTDDGNGGKVLTEAALAKVREAVHALPSEVALFHHDFTDYLRSSIAANPLVSQPLLEPSTRLKIVKEWFSKDIIAQPFLFNRITGENLVGAEADAAAEEHRCRHQLELDESLHGTGRDDYHRVRRSRVLTCIARGIANTDVELQLLEGTDVPKVDGLAYRVVNVDGEVVDRGVVGRSTDDNEPLVAERRVEPDGASTNEVEVVEPKVSEVSPLTMSTKQIPVAKQVHDATGDPRYVLTQLDELPTEYTVHEGIDLLTVGDEAIKHYNSSDHVVCSSYLAYLIINMEDDSRETRLGYAVDVFRRELNVWVESVSYDSLRAAFTKGARDNFVDYRGDDAETMAFVIWYLNEGRDVMNEVAIYGGAKEFAGLRKAAASAIVLPSDVRAVG